MNYRSTRGQSDQVLAAEAILRGLAPDGGLYVPELFPILSVSELISLKKANYQERAFRIMRLFLPEFSEPELKNCISAAYNHNTFDDPAVAPLKQLTSDVHILELWHGPTSAFKDMALQMLPRLHMVSVTKAVQTQGTVILVATSGDTGKAALEGFKNVDGTQIIVFYPQDGVSEVQKQQMLTQEGSNVFVVGVLGNFDDAQTGVKQIFNDQEMIGLLAEAGLTMSSANSINWGRLLPQIVYYISAYVDLMSDDQINNQMPVNFTVPTGNFGNILAAYYASRMGIPVHKLICASNSNNVLTDFLHTGEYNRQRDFFQTISPSMDILISSNLERLLYELTDHDTTRVSGWMHNLNQAGYYTVDAPVLKQLHQLFEADFCDDSKTLQTIREVWNQEQYLLDTHTAVAFQVYQNYRKFSGDTTPTVIVSTASPFKFTHSVARAVLSSEQIAEAGNEFDLINTLAKITDQPVPLPLCNLDQKPILHSSVCQKTEMADTVLKLLGLIS
ncbi:MAG: threonine synthase [Methylocystaceae bacterium]